MKKLFYLLLAVMAVSFAACSSSDDDDKDKVEVKSSKTPVVYSDDNGESGEITFTASANWTAEVNDISRASAWMRLSKTSGPAGDVSIAIIVDKKNDTGKDREAKITINCGNAEQTIITVTQKTITREEGSNEKVEKIKKEMAKVGNELTTKTAALRNAKMLKVLKAYAALNENPGFGISEDRDIYIKDLVGTFDWNTTELTFLKAANSSTEKLIVNFPAENSSKNNCKIEATASGSGVKTNMSKKNDDADKSSFSVFPVTLRYTTKAATARQIELPNAVDATLYLDNNSTGNISAKFTGVSATEAPKSATLSCIFAEGYTLAAEADKSNPNTGKVEFKQEIGRADIKPASPILFSFSGSLVATLLLDEIKDLGEATVNGTIMDAYQINGTGDMKKINEGMNKINGDSWSKGYNEEKAKLYNQHMKIALLSGEEKVATLIWEAIAYNSTYYSITPMLLFEDNTKVSFNSYFGTGFEDIYNAWKDYFNNL